MKNSLLVKFAFLVLSALFIVGCSTEKSDTNLYNYIPNDAVVVGAVNSDNLISKAGDQVDQLIRMMELDEEGNKLANAFINNPEQFGIEKGGEAIFYLVPNKKAEPEFAMIIPLVSAEKFEKLLVSLSEEKLDLMKSNGVSYVLLPEEDKLCMAWDDRMAVVFTVQDVFSSTEEAVTAFWSPVLKESLVENPYFSSFSYNSKDIKFWVSLSGITGLQNELAGFYDEPVIGITDKLYCMYDVDFKSDEVRSEWQIMGEDSVINRYMEMVNENVEKDLMKSLPGKSLLALGFSYDMDKYYSFMDAQLKASGIEEEDLDEVKEVTSLSFEQLVKAFGGSLVLNFSDISPSYKPTASIVFDVANEADILKLFDAVTVDFPVEKSDKYSTIQIPMVPIYFSIINDNAIVTTDKQTLDAFIAGEKVAESMVSVDMFLNSPAFFYLNLDLDTYPALVKQQMGFLVSSSETAGLYKLLQKTVDLTAVSSPNFEENSITLKLKSSSKENSLESILSCFVTEKKEK